MPNEVEWKTNLIWRDTRLCEYWGVPWDEAAIEGAVRRTPSMLRERVMVLIII